jgi:hypothetical protein
VNLFGCIAVVLCIVAAASAIDDTVATAVVQFINNCIFFNRVKQT